MGFWARTLVQSILFLTLAYLMPGFYVSSFWAAFLASIVLAIMNVLVKPILSILSFPITLLTFGLFSFVINALMLAMTAGIMGDSFSFAGFGTAFVVSLILTAAQSWLNPNR